MAAARGELAAMRTWYRNFLERQAASEDISHEETSSATPESEVPAPEQQQREVPDLARDINSLREELENSQNRVRVLETEHKKQEDLLLQIARQMSALGNNLRSAVAEGLDDIDRAQRLLSRVGKKMLEASGHLEAYITQDKTKENEGRVRDEERELSASFAGASIENPSCHEPRRRPSIVFDNQDSDMEL